MFECRYVASGSYTGTSNARGGDAASTIIINYFPDALPDFMRDSYAALLGTRPRAYSANGLSLHFFEGRVGGSPNCGKTYEAAPGPVFVTNSGPTDVGLIAADGNLRGSFVDDSGSLFKWDIAPVREP